MTTKSADKRFFNMPLCLLAKTFDDQGMADILSYCLADTAGRLDTDRRRALIQLVYVRSQRPNEALPSRFAELFKRPDMDELVAAVPESFGDDFLRSMNERLDASTVCLPAAEWDAITAWHRLSMAANTLGYTIGSHDATWRRHAKLSQFVEKHGRDTGSITWCSVPKDLFEEAKAKPWKHELFRTVAAVRSLVGNHRFTATTKAMIQARMVGAKSTRIVASMPGEALQAEYTRLGHRRQFDNALLDAASRGFFAKLGMARRIWLSVVAQTPKELGDMVAASNRRRNYEAAERQAREAMQ